MTITFTREYPRASVAPTSESMSDVILSVYCVLTLTDENGKTMSAGKDIPFNPPMPTSFVSFVDITKDMIDAWVLSRDAYIAFENKILAEFTKIPDVVIKDLPFNVVVEPVVEVVEPVTVPIAEVVVEPVIEVVSPAVIEETPLLVANT